MKHIRHQTDLELAFTVKDCREAISANPDNPKIFQYLQEKNAAEDEITRRQRTRIFRGMLRHTHDPLTVPIRRRSWVRNSGFERDQFRSGCFMAGWYRLYECRRWMNQPKEVTT